MTRLLPRTALRRAAGGLAAGGPARADGPVFTLGGPARTALYPHPASGVPRTTPLGFTVATPDGEGFRGDVVYTVDLSGVAGIADVTAAGDGAAHCEMSASTAVCRDTGVLAGGGVIAGFGLTAAPGGENGASGVIRITGEAAGAAFTPFTAEVTVGGPDLVMERLPFEQRMEPGDAQPAPITFGNRGTTAADGVLLTLMYSRGLDIPERYANCVYDDEAGDDPGNAYAWSTALCSVEGSFEPGVTYTLGVPLSVRATERAYRDTFVYRIHEGDGVRRPAPSDRTGPELTVRQVRTAASGRDLDPGDNQQEADFATDNTAGFAAYGTDAEGAEGETVTARVGFRNEGPAWIGDLRSGEPVATLDVTVPEGAEVTGKPQSCRGVTADGRHLEKQLGAPRYFCASAATVRDGADIEFPFTLRIDTVVADASGAVTVRGTRPDDPSLPFDPDVSDNTARLLLNPADPDGGGTGGTGGSSEGTSGGAGGGAAQGSAGTPGTGSAPGPAGAAGASGVSGSASAGTGGVLASTGAAARTAASAAAGALLAGGVLFVMARRPAGRG
ncbi:peptidase [Streptomyces sp. NPDC001822]|uniref:peptidase n=1 Tax=Streptomyces sp. NPDC001822 TaxID=3364614 RepID=UPI0036BEB8DD